MPDIGAIAGLVSSLKAATDISKAMLGLRDGAMIQNKVIELQGAILSAQQSALSAQTEQFELANELRELKAKLSAYANWEKQKSKYVLKNVGEGVAVFLLRDPSENDAPHWLCASCFEKNKKSYLQYQGRTGRNDQNVFKCAGCNGLVITRYTVSPGKE